MFKVHSLLITKIPPGTDNNDTHIAMSQCIDTNITPTFEPTCLVFTKNHKDSPKRFPLLSAKLIVQPLCCNQSSNSLKLNPKFATLVEATRSSPAFQIFRDAKHNDWTQRI